VTAVILVGLILLLALIGGHLAQLLKAPEVVGYFAVGLLMGPSFSEILTHNVVTALEFFSEIALGLILFSMGAVFDFENLRKVGRRTILLTCYIVAGTASAVFLSIMAFNQEWPVALMLGAIAVEVSPIATVLVLREANSEGPLTDAIYNVVALNNVACLLAFGITTFAIRIFEGGGSARAVLPHEFLLFLWSNVGAVALGVVLGYMLAFWGRQVHEHGELLMLVLGTLLVAVGAAYWLAVSSLIASMTLGATLINLEPQAKRLFSILAKTDPPLYAIFFVLAGAHLQVSSLLLIGLTGMAYTIARIIGKMVGCWVGAGRLGYAPSVKRYLGMTLVAHAGVAIGLSLQIRTAFPQYAEVIATVILGSVLLNEVLGPVLTKFAIVRAGETQRQTHRAFEPI